MINRFSTDLKEQKIYANGYELATVMGMDRDSNGHRVYDYPESEEKLAAILADPKLMTDVYKISKLEPAVRDTILKLYESPMKITEYNGVKLHFEQGRYKSVWGPNIDTLLFCRAVNKLNAKRFKGKDVIEIGPGSGFISKYLLEKFPEISSMTLVDINPYAIESSKDNIKDLRASFIVGDAVEYLEGRKFDILVCNPPYIPRPGSIDDNPYEGTGLIKHLIKNFRQIINPGGMIITNLSSLSDEEVRKVTIDAGLKEKKLDKMTVPLKVCNVLNNRDWLDYLLAHGLKKERKSGYDYHHTITINTISDK